MNDSPKTVQTNITEKMTTATKEEVKEPKEVDNSSDDEEEKLDPAE